MTNLENNNHSEVQIQILRLSIEHLGRSLELAMTAQDDDDYWIEKRQEIAQQLYNEKQKLQEYKDTQPELFI